MSFRISDGFHSCPEVDEIPLPAVGLWALGGSWAAKYPNDFEKFTPRSLVRFGATTEDAASLVAAGLWAEVDGGWTMARDDLGKIQSDSNWHPNRKYIPDALRLLVHEDDGWACVTCGGTEDLQVDHIIPVSKGGTNARENLQTMCGIDNRQKGARLGLV